MSTGDVLKVCAAVRRGPVFNLPLLREGQRDARGDLVRIVDPAGLAVAWFDPRSARCVEFMVRSPDEDQTAWRSVFAVPDEKETDARFSNYGVLAAVGDASSWIAGAEFENDRSGAGWVLLERDPTSVILQTGLRDEVGADVGDVYGRLVAQLDDATLSLALTVQNDGVMALPVAFGFRGVFPHGLETDFAVASLVTTKTVVLPHVVVTCDEGVHYLDPGAGFGTGNLSVAMLGAPPGQPVVVLPGAEERLAIALSIFTGAEGRTEILRLRGQNDR